MTVVQNSFYPYIVPDENMYTIIMIINNRVGAFTYVSLKFRC